MPACPNDESHCVSSYNFSHKTFSHLQDSHVTACPYDESHCVSSCNFSHKMFSYKKDIHVAP